MGFFDKIIAAIKMFGTPEVLLLLALVALFVVYGRNIRRVGTRGMVLIGVFCALAGALGAAMRAIPGVQPTCFLVMMAGVLLGPGAGLAAGAVSALLFDFLSVVSIYTPWRMMLWGLMGLGAAYLPRKLWLLAVYGFVWGFVFGWVSNLVYFVDGFLPFTWAAVIASCAASFWFEVSHALCNACLLLFLSLPVAAIARRSGIGRPFLKKKANENDSANLHDEGGTNA